MLAVVFFNYLIGLQIADNTTYKGKKKIYLIIGVVFDLLVLVFFKYTNFIVGIINHIPVVKIPLVNIKLPLGISFYIFQAMTYIIDVYRDDCKVQKKVSLLVLYISFFPQLIAGPIVKYKDIEENILAYTGETNDNSVDRFHIGKFASAFDGIYRFAIGLAKKVLIANMLGRVVSLLLRENVITRVSIWCGLIFYLLQLYFDFSGYSDMAIGLGKVFGFNYKENFDYPYISKSLTEYWRRWHISLGTFFREYVYIPLGGKYKHQIRNIIIVWALTGLWHGASINFMLWGLYFAIILIIEKYVFKNLIGDSKNIILNILRHIYTIFLLVVGIVLFYFDNLQNILTAYSAMFFPKAVKFSNTITMSILKENVVVFLIAIVFSTPFAKEVSKLIYDYVSEKAIVIVKTIVIIVLIFMSTIFILGDSYNPFLYFRF